MESNSQVKDKKSTFTDNQSENLKGNENGTNEQISIGNKSKLKSLFDDIDTQDNKMKKLKITNPTKPLNKKLENNLKVSQNNKTFLNSQNITNNMLYNEKKTKPTKPDFSAQLIEVSIADIPGINAHTSSNNFKGLTNFGNICYSNVIMQCLISIKEFVDMLNLIHSQLENSDVDNIQYDYPFLYNLVKIMNFYKIKNTALASNHIKLIVNMFDFSGEQNDAHEFLVYIFDKLNDEILKLSKIIKLEGNIINHKQEADFSEWEEVKKGGKRMKAVNTINSFQTSIIGKLFQGVLKHDIQSKGDSVSKCNIEPFFVLSLDFGENSIASCFGKYFSKKKIENDKYSINQKSYLDCLPEILIVHLKAFYFDKTTQKIVKIMKEIEYGEDLKLGEYVSPSMQNMYKKVTYELISVIIHKGTKASEGHYICFCKDDNDAWWSLDDKKVIKVEFDAISAKFRPYILFYRIKTI